VWSGTEKNGLTTTHYTPYIIGSVYTIATTPRSYYKNTTNTLPIVVTCHPLLQQRKQKNGALSAQKMRDKRATLLTFDVVCYKKTAVTPL
jgi:hypothetical protein